jgi:hypothetical protein
MKQINNLEITLLKLKTLMTTIYIVPIVNDTLLQVQLRDILSLAKRYLTDLNLQDIEKNKKLYLVLQLATL